MAGIDHAPPPFFKQGPAPLALLTFYVLISLAIFVVDLRFRSLDLLRQSVALVVDPVQRVAQTPGSLVDYARSYLQGMRLLQSENDELRHAKLNTAPNLLRLEQLEQQVGDPGVGEHGGLDVLLAEGRPGLAEVPGVGAQD